MSTSRSVPFSFEKTMDYLLLRREGKNPVDYVPHARAENELSTLAFDEEDTVDVLAQIERIQTEVTKVFEHFAYINPCQKAEKKLQEVQKEAGELKEIQQKLQQILEKGSQELAARRQKVYAYIERMQSLCHVLRSSQSSYVDITRAGTFAYAAIMIQHKEK